MQRFLKSGLLVLVAALSLAAGPQWDPAPWLADLNQLRASIDHDYPNREWLTGQREVSLDRWFDRTANAIRQGGGDREARSALDRLIERFNDGHITLSWAGSGGAGATPDHASRARPTLAGFCAARGYDAGQVTAGTAAAVSGYRRIDTGGPLAAGVVSANRTTIGVVRIGIFSPQGYPTLCEQAVANVGVAIDQPCDEACDDRVVTEAYRLLTRSLITAVERVHAVGAQVLLVDLTGNGGGSEWAEAAARIVSPVSLRSAPLGVVRGEAWVHHWRDLAAKLRREADTTGQADRAMLTDLAARADAIAEGLKPCPGTRCSLLSGAGFASGLVPEIPAGRLDGRKWAADVFSPAQFPYRDRVWNGPVIVLVDNETWSAAEQFTALLRDNGAVVVMGGRTGGAGCGHLDHADPVTLDHSKGVLEMPNCARFRRDGSNEVSGIVPDVMTGARANDGVAYAGRLTAAQLPAAILQAKALFARQRR